jgi:hypothetical protein
MKQPCDNCPFLRDSAIMISKAKASEIIKSIGHDGSFHCHKTVDYSGKKPKVTKDSKLCFGSVLFLENVASGGCRSNVAYRFGLILGEYRLSDLRKDVSVYATASDFVDESY